MVPSDKLVELLISWLVQPDSTNSRISRCRGPSSATRSYMADDGNRGNSLPDGGKRVSPGPAGHSSGMAAPHSRPLTAEAHTTVRARAWALLAGRDYLLPEDIQAILPSVVDHRLQTIERDAALPSALMVAAVDPLARQRGGALRP